MWELDDTILSILEQEDAVQELETVLSRDDRIQELIVKIERCMNKVPKESIEPSHVMSSSNPSLLSHNPDVKVKLPKLEIQWTLSNSNSQGEFEFARIMESSD